MLSKFHKYLKKIGLSFIGGVFALALGLLLLVPEAQSGETGTKKFTRASREVDGGRKKMNRTNRSATYVPTYNVQRVTYGPTDVVPRKPRRPDYMIMNGETNYVVRGRGVVIREGETNDLVLVRHGENHIAQGEKEGDILIKGSERNADQPTGVHRIGRKGKEKERQRQAVLAELENAKGFAKEKEKDGRKNKLDKEGKSGDSMDASESSTNGIKTLVWQTAAPPSGSVHTASSPRRAGSLEHRGDRERGKDINNSARKIKERNRERQVDSETNIIRRAHNTGSADDKADADN